MNDAQAEVQEVPATEVAAPAEAAPVMKDFTYSYQMTTEDGKPMMGLQVGKYRAEKELPIETFASAIRAHEMATRALIANKRKQQAEASAPAVPAVPVAAVPTDEQKALIIQGQQAVTEFRRITPEYAPTDANSKALIGFILENDLQPTLESFQLAYTTLSKAGRLESVPAVRQPQAIVHTSQEAPVERPTEEIPAAPVNSVRARSTPPRLPTGLNRSNSSDEGSKLLRSRPRYTDEEIEKMSAEQYKKLVVEPEFAERKRKDLR
jgi:hypothetical protein